jgi:hypothetical protein
MILWSESFQDCWQQCHQRLPQEAVDRLRINAITFASALQLF